MPFGVVSESGTVASWLQSSWSSAGGSTSVVADNGSTAASQDSPLTAGKSEKDNAWTEHLLHP